MHVQAAKELSLGEGRAVKHLRPFVVVRLVKIDGVVLASGQTLAVKAEAGVEPVWRRRHGNRMTLKCTVPYQAKVRTPHLSLFIHLHMPASKHRRD